MTAGTGNGEMQQQEQKQISPLRCGMAYKNKQQLRTSNDEEQATTKYRDSGFARMTLWRLFRQNNDLRYWRL
jgi:hypothetical protein